MSNQQDWVEKRTHPRIEWRFVTRYRDINQSEVAWELPTLKDLSEGGCYFYSPSKCEVGQELEIEIQIPRFPDPVRFIGKVLRVDTASGGMAEYGIAIQFTKVDEAKEEKFKETLKLMVEKQQGS